MTEPTIKEVIVELRLIVSPKAPVSGTHEEWALHAASMISLHSDYCNAVVSKTDEAVYRERCHKLEGALVIAASTLKSIHEELSKALAL